MVSLRCDFCQFAAPIAIALSTAVVTRTSLTT